MATAATRTPDEFEARLRDYVRERAEESRVVRIGEKSVSEQAVIVARYADLFTLTNLAELRAAEDAEMRPAERERLHRLRRTCESGLQVARLAPLQDALTTAELGAVVQVNGTDIPLRTAVARLGSLTDYDERETLGESAMDVSATLNAQRLELVDAGEELQAELSGEPDPIARAEGEKGISLRALADVLVEARDLTAAAYEELRTRWLGRLLGPSRAAQPSSYHAPYVLRLSALESVYTKDRATDVCLATLAGLGFDLVESGIQLDLDDRPQKSPRPSVIAPDPPWTVYLITRPQGGLQDYQNFLHEAGHALHYASCDQALPYAFRLLARDYGLTEVYAYVMQHVTCEPGWHARHFDLPADGAAENAEAARFLDAFMFRRFLAKLQFELEFWTRFREDGATPTGYAEHLTSATGFTYRPDRYLADMDPGFYAADYARAWIRSAQVRAYLRGEVGADWWRSPATGTFLRGLFREGTRPSSEDIATRLGFEPLDVRPLVAELSN